MDMVSENICSERRRVISERNERDRKVIEGIDERMRKLENLSIQLGEMLKTEHEKIENCNKRLEVLESKPAERLNNIINSVLQWAVLAFLATLELFS